MVTKQDLEKLLDEILIADPYESALKARQLREAWKSFRLSRRSSTSVPEKAQESAVIEDRAT